MKDIAIITPVGQFNYGNRLQNYALVRIAEMLGYRVDTLSIEENTKKYWIKRGLEITSLWPLLLGLHQRERRVDLDWRRYCSFKKFTQKKIPTRYCGPKSISGLPNEYRYFLIGSDQIWNPKQLARDCDFADFAQAGQKVPVAPSFGVSQLPEQQYERIKTKLNAFCYLSARENSGVRLIEEMTGRKAQLLIDPTAVLSCSDWRDISVKPRKVDTDKPYILTYFLGGKNAEAKRQVKDIARDTDCEIYPLLDKSRPELYVSGPAEFLWLIEHAKLVCTDSFHAVMFSVLFGRPFIVYQRDGDGAGMEDRIATLLQIFHLENRLPGCVKHKDIFLCDYTDTNMVLERERKAFLRYLEKAGIGANI